MKALEESNTRRHADAEQKKEKLLTATIMALIIVTAFVLTAIGTYIDFSLDYDTIANLFFSSMLILAAIVIVENTSKLVITASVFSGVFVSTGLYLIWSAS
jgi:K+-sensing histidine kinase KdpD